MYINIKALACIHNGHNYCTQKPWNIKYYSNNHNQKGNMCNIQYEIFKRVKRAKKRHSNIIIHEVNEVRYCTLFKTFGLTLILAVFVLIP